MTLVSVAGAIGTVTLVVVLGHLHDGSGVAWARVISQVALALTLVAVLQHQRLLGRIWRAS